MNIDKVGYYKTRKGSRVHVVGFSEVNTYPVIGVFVGSHSAPMMWTRQGEANIAVLNADNDLVEYIGERLKKKVKLAPALCHTFGDYYVENSMYASENEAKRNKTFVKWLIDTPYAIEVEVEE